MPTEEENSSKKLVKKPNTQKRAKKMKKGLAKSGKMWYYTQAPRAAGKNDFWKAAEAKGKNQCENAEK